MFTFFWLIFFPALFYREPPQEQARQKLDVERIEHQRNLIDSLLKANPEHFANVLSQVQKHELQIIFTQISRDNQNKPSFVHHYFRVNPEAYFNPASLVKLPVSLLAMEKVRKLAKHGVTLDSPMETLASGRCQTPVYPFKGNNLTPSLSTYISRMMLVSDNNSYNRAYEFLGQEYLNKRLWELGFPTARVTQRFANCNPAANRCTNPVRFYSGSRKLLYSQPAACNPQTLKNSQGSVYKGIGHFRNGKYLKSPFDFTYSNSLTLPDVHRMLMTVMFPESMSKQSGWQLEAEDYRFIRSAMGKYPAESEFMEYRTKPTYYPSLKKYLYYGSRKQAVPEPHLRIFNVVGMSYGYLSDCAYFADFNTGTEFFLSAVLYVNRNEIINDGTYEYKSVGLPFLANLGKVFLAYEQTQVKTRKPDLSEFRLP